MTYEEVANKLRHDMEESDVLTAEEKDMISFIVEALEKQIPKKAVRDKEWRFNLLCPCCNRKIADTEHFWDIQRKYLEEQEFRCPCGQALDWSDDDEQIK